jgi:hypothetical protein
MASQARTPVTVKFSYFFNGFGIDPDVLLLE